MILMLLALGVVACTKENRTNNTPGGHVSDRGKEICFVAEGLAPYTGTKVSEVTLDNLSSFNLMAMTGIVGAETERWTVTATKDASSGRFVSGKYWPYTNPSYHFYASNMAMTASAGGASVTVDGSSDVVCACLYEPEFNVANALTFSHILARVGTVDVVSEKGYGLSVASVKMLQVKTSGKYNLRTSSWSDSAGALSTPINEGENDYLLLPGTYVMEVVYTLTKGDYTGTFTSSGEVNLVAGKISNVRVNLSADPAVAVNFTVSVEEWDSRTIGLTLG